MIDPSPPTSFYNTRGLDCKRGLGGGGGNELQRVVYSCMAASGLVTLLVAWLFCGQMTRFWLFYFMFSLEIISGLLALFSSFFEEQKLIVPSAPPPPPPPGSSGSIHYYLHERYICSYFYYQTSVRG